MPFIIDIILMLIVAISMFIGFKRGFFKTVIDMLSTVLAFVITYFAYRPVANIINKKFIMPKITELIKNIITSNGTVNNIAKMFSEKKSFFLNIINRFSNLEKVESYYNTIKESDKAVDKVSEYMAAPISSTLSRAISIVGVFIIAIVVLKIVSMLIGLTLHLPVLKQADGLLGLIFGTVIGLAIAWGLSIITVNSLDSLIALYPKIFPEGKTSADIVESTLLLRLLYGVSPAAVIALLTK